jgi:hypothetical protein
VAFGVRLFLESNVEELQRSTEAQLLQDRNKGKYQTYTMNCGTNDNFHKGVEVWKIELAGSDFHMVYHHACCCLICCVQGIRIRFQAIRCVTEERSRTYTSCMIGLVDRNNYLGILLQFFLSSVSIQWECACPP